MEGIAAIEALEKLSGDDAASVYLVHGKER